MDRYNLLTTTCLRDILEKFTAIELTAVARTSRLWAKYVKEIGIVTGIEEYYMRAVSASNMRVLRAWPDLWSFDMRINNINVVRNAAIRGDLELLQWIHKTYDILPLTVGDDAAENGHIHILEWLKRDKLCNIVTKAGSIAVIDWLNEQGGMTSTHFIALNASLNGRLDILQHLYLTNKSVREWITLNVSPYVDEALKGNHIDVLAWLISKSPPVNSSAYNHVKSKEALDYLLDHNAIKNDCYGYSAEKYACIMKYGGYKYVKKVVTRDLTLYQVQLISNYAAELGNMDMLQYINKSRGIRYGSDTIENAALSGNIEMLEMLRTQPGVLCTSSKLTANAAKNGHYHVLEWAEQWNIPINCTAYEQALIDGNIAMLDYLYAKGVPLGDKHMSIYVTYGKNLDAFKWLMERDPEWNPTTSRAFKCLLDSGDLKLIKWAIDNGLPIPADIATIAAEKYSYANICRMLKLYKAPKA